MYVEYRMSDLLFPADACVCEKLIVKLTNREKHEFDLTCSTNLKLCLLVI